METVAMFGNNYLQLKRITALSLLLVALGGCWNLKTRPPVGPPWKQKLLWEGPENATPKFKKGWHDGCESAASAYTNNFYRYWYTFRQDSSLAQDKEYYIGWKVAWEFCGRYVFHYTDTEIIAGSPGDGLEIMKAPTIMPNGSVWGPNGGDLNIWGDAK